MDFSTILQPENIQLYWDGLVNVLLPLATSLLVVGLMALPLAVAMVSENKFIQGSVCCSPT